MRLWTILTEPAWQSLNDRGYLICDDEALGEELYLTAYKCMMQQIYERLGPPDPAARLPLWAWYQYQGALFDLLHGPCELSRNAHATQRTR